MIAIVASEDTHYSIAKGANLLMVDWISVPVVFDTRAIDTSTRQPTQNAV
jgi:glutamate/tyrosine decarboxylase-like PLP-dependent enzyme